MCRVTSQALTVTMKTDLCLLQ